jgi:hypothetical protein
VAARSLGLVGGPSSGEKTAKAITTSAAITLIKPSLKFLMTFCPPIPKLPKNKGRKSPLELAALARLLKLDPSRSLLRKLEDDL